MRKTCLIIMALFLTAGFTFGQSETSMAPILEEAIPVIETIEGEDLEIVRMEFDIIGGIELTNELSDSQLSKLDSSRTSFYDNAQRISA